MGVLSAIGLVVLFGLAWRAEGGTEMFRGALVQDELALFAKRLFLLATLIGVLASLPPARGGLRPARHRVLPGRSWPRSWAC